MLEYLSIRGHQPGLLFISTRSQAVSREMFVNFLSRALVHCNLDPSRYKGHSFRIGTASHAAKEGFTEARISGWVSGSQQHFLSTFVLPTFPTR